jgi:hypothetical protein
MLAPHEDPNAGGQVRDVGVEEGYAHEPTFRR